MKQAIGNAALLLNRIHKMRSHNILE